MKPITEKERQELIAYARIEISRWVNIPDKRYMSELMEIALASLTAEPEVSEIESVHPENGNTIIHLRRGGLKNISSEDIAEYEMIETEKFYTAPPVPVNKLPDDGSFDMWFKSIEAGDDDDWHEPEYMSKDWHEYMFRRQLALGAYRLAIDKIKHLNGIK